MIGILWTVQAFTERVFNDLWWLGLMSGIRWLDCVLGQRPVLPDARGRVAVFAGIWALVKGITDIVRAFQLRQLGSS